jgi:hypothetical protein
MLADTTIDTIDTTEDVQQSGRRPGFWLYTTAGLHRPYSNGLPGRVEVQGRMSLLAATDARLLVAPERHLELDACGRHVDVHEAGLRTL